MILNYEEGDVFGPGEEESTGPLMWDPSHVVSGKPAPAPRKPVGKPKKKPRQPVFLGEWEQETAALGEQGKQHQATERQIDAAMARGGAFQGGLASGQQSVQPKLRTPLKRGYTKVQQGATSKVVSPTGLPVSEGTYAQDVENRHPDVAQMWPSDSKEVARLDEIARLSQPGFVPAMDRGMLRSNETVKNFGAGALSLIDDLGKAIHPTNFVGGDSEGMVHAMARKLSASSQDDAATIGGVSAQYGSPAEYLTEVGRGLPGMLGSIYLSTQMTGNPALGFAVQKMAEARGHGITDPHELAREGLMGLVEGKLFHKVGEMPGGLSRIATQGALGAAQPIGESLARGQGLPNAQTMIEGGLTNAILDLVPGMGGGIDHPARAAKALEALQVAEQLKVGDALVDPSPRSFASLPPKVREAALLNWHMDAHPSLKADDGTPKTFYHGTPAGEFDFFDPEADENIGSHFGSQTASNMFSDSGKGTTYPVYLNIKNPAFTSDIYPVYDLRNALENTRDDKGQPVFNSQEIEEIINKSPGGGNSYEDETDIDKALGHPAWKKTYQWIEDVNPQLDKHHPMDQEKLKSLAALEIKNVDPTYFGVQESIASPSQLFKAALESKGFDGIQYINQAEDPGHTSHIAFYPHQVKSAFAKEFDPQSIKIQASFKPNELQAMEQRALEAGKPIALRPETRDAYTARNQEIKGQLLAMDPASPEFARLADEHTRLARAIDEAPEVLPQSAEELRQHLVQMNMGHEGAAQEMLDILRPPSGGSPLKLDIDKFETARQSSIQGARFYPLNDATKGGSVYVTPQTFEDSGLIEKGQRSEVGAVNVPLDEALNTAARMQESQPDVAAALVAAVKEAEAKGISKISVLSYAEGQGLGETRKLMRHESFHSGQQAAAEAADVMGIDVRDLHPPDLIYNPLLTKAAQTENGQSILKYYEGNLHDLALEMAAYSAADQHDYIGLSKKEAASYLTDYLTGIADQHGPDALDALAGTARLSPRVEQQVKEISSEAKPKKNFGQANRDFAAQLRSQPSASGRPTGPEGRSEGGSSVDEGGIAEGGDQDEVSGMAGGPVEGPPSGSGSSDSAVKNDGPELFTTVLTSDVVKEYAKKSGEALRKLGLLDENSLLPPHEQILKVLKERPDLAEPAALGAALREQGVTGEETLKQIDEAAANAGRTLQAIQAADAQWIQIIKEHPEVAAELAKAGVGPKPEQIIKQGFKEIQTSVLGRSLWRRAGDLYRKMLLTRFSTAANNAVSTLPRIPLDLVDGAMTGTAMGMLQPEKWAGKSDASLAEGAKAGALAGMQASTRVAMAFPDVARKLLRRETPAHNFNEMIIAQMEQLHPDLHSKLEGRSTGLDEFKESSVKLDTIRGLLPYLNDASKFKEYSTKLDMYQKRYDFNHKLAGKLFDKTNWVYDQFLKPGNVQEFFFRRPYFVGALANRAAAAGFNLSELAANAGTLKDFAADPGGKDAQAIMQLQTLADLPPEVWEAAADDALTFTYAYNPHRDRGGIEKFASHYIEFMDSLGPVGAVVDAFPKAVYNGLKFAYEYGPIGMIKPVANITDNVYKGGGRNGIEYNDVSRISKALLGTAMYATAIGIRKELGGDEWWQIKTGKKNKKGEPEYLNVKKWMPFAGFLYVADLILRMKNGRMIDKKPGDDMAELYLGARRADSGGTVFSESIKEVADYWASGDPLDDTLLNKAGKPLGNILGAPLTPLINLRDLIGQFDEDEAARRDMKESPFLGPAIDRIPWLRSSEKYGLPLYQPPTELAPRPANAQPALSLGGIATDPGSNFATREFSRLGLSPVRWLRPDPDPLINRAQYAAYAEMLQELGPALEADATYKAASDAEKGAMWEQLLSGPEGYASMAKAQGELANPEEIQRRELLKTQGPLQRKASGLEKEVKEMKKQAQPRP